MLVAEWQARSHGQFSTGVILTPLLLQGLEPHPRHLLEHRRVDPLLRGSPSTSPFPGSSACPGPKALPPHLPAPWHLVVSMVPHSSTCTSIPTTSPAPPPLLLRHLIRFLKYTPLSYACTFLAGITLGQLQAGLTITQRHRASYAGASLAAIGTLLRHGRRPRPLHPDAWRLPRSLFAALVFGPQRPEHLRVSLCVEAHRTARTGSYALFLLHFNFINLLRSHHIPERLHLAAYDPWVSYAATLVLAIVAMQLVEKPARKAILARRTPQ